MTPTLHPPGVTRQRPGAKASINHFSFWPWGPRYQEPPLSPIRQKRSVDTVEHTASPAEGQAAIVWASIPIV